MYLFRDVTVSPNLYARLFKFSNRHNKWHTNLPTPKVEVFIARVVPLSYFYFYFFPAQDMQQMSYLLFAYFGTIAL